MLHVTTNVGKPGRNEREKKHFPELTNQSIPPQKHPPHGRRYLGHGHSEHDYDSVWRPHNQAVQPALTHPGPDWDSRLRYIPAPQNDSYPKVEIFPEAWHAMRAFPNSQSRTQQEYNFYSEEPHGKYYNKRTLFPPDLQHVGSTHCLEEKEKPQYMGRARRVDCLWKRRNELPFAAPGDKNYQAVEYQSGFHKMGTTLPLANFGGSHIVKPVTFIPLFGLPPMDIEPYSSRDKRRKKDVEMQEVKELDFWRPATPLMPSHDLKV